MDESTGILPGLPAIAGKLVHVAFDGGRLTSDAGILLLAAIEQRLKIAERLAACIEDPRDPERVLHGLAEMIRFYISHGLMPFWVSIVTAIIAALFSGTLMHRFVELPAIKLGQRVARAGKLPTAAQPPAVPEPDEAKAA
jgi:DDE family transposase